MNGRLHQTESYRLKYFPHESPQYVIEEIEEILRACHWKHNKNNDLVSNIFLIFLREGNIPGIPPKMRRLREIFCSKINNLIFEQTSSLFPSLLTPPTLSLLEREGVGVGVR